MKQDRFLTGILIGIGVLILLALVLFFMRQDKRAYVDDGTPDGVVHNYVLAVLNKDYEKAYGYLADLDNKPTYDEFRRSFFNGSLSNNQNMGVDVGTVEIHGNEAIVSLTLVYTSNDPFSSGYQNQESAMLEMQNGKWKLSSMPTYSYWDYNWYQKQPPKP